MSGVLDHRCGVLDHECIVFIVTVCGKRDAWHKAVHKDLSAPKLELKLYTLTQKRDSLRDD